ncbi:phosphate propanoyltransferase [Tepidimicrobium xylanilyticum]|uniref:Phosphate propanoyltransferase n=1 Tax=Tepidimicrobium xylanilyticum TaxID=1123352 RepID=A0A1H2SU65_9FIRM|nr:phosphate propanoyltransferase [Tepidimicrobium xylanilyticum]GMG96131.1 phosphotransacetylase [Tepidimicrobium xylanilyticum]SDW34574.1 putative phosphotransacetylase [Tepidimicrobium xylanilyticum]
MDLKLPIALSNRHIHLSKKDLDTLFGEGYELTKTKDLSQPGQFACEEKVDIQGPKGVIKGVRVLGPVRGDTQIEVSISDAFKLGVDPVIRNSGDIEGTPGVKVIGPKDEVDLDKGVIVAARHIHMHTSDGERFNVKDGDIVKVKTKGIRSVIFENVLVRVKGDYALEMHVDIEEGNAAGVKNGDLVELIKE